LVISRENSSNELFIYLNSNELNGSSFEEEVFTHPSLKNLKISLFSLEKKIDYLDEAVFAPFLSNGNGNSIWIGNNQALDCDDCRSAWICKSNKSDQMRKAFVGEAKCIDGRDFTDCQNNFLRCK